MKPRKTRELERLLLIDLLAIAVLILLLMVVKSVQG
jgi:hypothetical protein